MDYDPHSLQIKVEAGVNSAVQKQLALDMIIKMMSSSELFNQFINTMGLEVLLDNMDIRNIDHLKAQAVEFMQQMKQQQEQAAQQPNPVEMEMETIKQIEMAKVQQRQQQAEGELSIKAAEVAVKQEQADLAYMKLIAEIEGESSKAMADERKADAEEARSAVDLAIEVAKLHHEQNKKED